MVSSISLRLRHEEPDRQPKTRALLADLQRNLEYGTAEQRNQDGKVTHLVVTQTIRAID